MKKTIIILLILGLFGTAASACEANNRPTDTSGGSGFVSSETSVSSLSPTPIPTYTPGTELYGILSVTGEVVVEPKYEYLDLFSDEGLARFCDHGRWGFVNTDGEEVIPAQYEEANNFSEGLAAVKVDGLWGFIDTTGAIVIEPQYLGAVDEFHHGRCTFLDNGLQGLIDKTGSVILNAKYKSIILKCENYFIVENLQNEFGIIDRDGNVIVECQYPKIYSVVDSGFFFVPSADSQLNALMCNIQGNKKYTVPYLYINSDFPLFEVKSDSIIEASEVTSEKRGLFDLASGKYLIEPVYDDVVFVPGNQYVFLSLGGYWGVADASTGVTILDCTNKECNKYFSYNYIVYEGSKDHWGVMNLDGTIVLPAEYENIVCSPNGEFGVVKNNKGMLLDEKGNTIKELSNSVVVEYVPSIDRWIYSNDYNAEGVSTYGIMSRDGSVFIETSFDDYYIYPKSLTSLYFYRKPYIYPKIMIDSYSYPNPIDLLDSTLIINLRLIIDGGGYPVWAVIHSQGYSSEVLYRDFDFFPDQQVLVVTDKNGNSGLVSYDGTVLFELQACRFFINDIGYHDPQKNYLFYDDYNDTDYLIYMVEAK